MGKPVISVVTICYNSVRTIEETLQSVISQKYPYLDYVIIDGGSTDGTLDVVERYQEYLGYFHSEPDEGISDAFNRGILHAKGDLIVIINSDDILLPNALALEMQRTHFPYLYMFRMSSTSFPLPDVLLEYFFFVKL